MGWKFGPRRLGAALLGATLLPEFIRKGVRA